MHLGEDDELQLRTTTEFCRQVEQQLRRTVDIIKQDEKSDIASRRFHSQIDNEKDLEKIKTPVLTYDEEDSERNYQTLIDIFSDILTIEKIGIAHVCFAPWGLLI